MKLSALALVAAIVPCALALPTSTPGNAVADLVHNGPPSPMFADQYSAAARLGESYPAAPFPVLTILWL